MSLIGATLRMNIYYPDIGQPISRPASAVVSASRFEFRDVDRFDIPNDGALQLVNADINFGGDQFVYTIDDTRFGRFASATFNGYVFEKTSAGGPTIFSATLASAGNTLGIDQGFIEVEDGQLRVNVSGLGVFNDRGFRLNLGFTYQGNATDDALIGGRFADQILGGRGEDRIVGGRGADFLDGGAGADIFDFNALADSTPWIHDVILGFGGAGRTRNDVIDLASIDADTEVAGNQAFRFGTAVGTARLWVVDGANGDTVVRANVDSDASAEFVLRIEDGARSALAYVSSDFIL